tara:strand:- start:13097 stop:15328 length:2232 start_codon:yes stop_codon:yes gene_type:complete
MKKFLKLPKIILCLALAAPMAAFAASPTVLGTITSYAEETNSSTLQGTYPSTINSDTGLFGCAAIDEDGTNSITWPGSWVEFLDDDTSGSTTMTSCARLDADGTETGTFNLTISGTTQKGSIFIAAIDGWDGSTNPEVNTANTAFDTTLSPNSITPAGGSDDYLYVAMVTNNDRPGTFSAFPSGYSDTGDEQVVTSGGAGIAWAFLESTASTTENPGSFTWTNAETTAGRTFAITPTAAASVCATTTAETTTTAASYDYDLENCTQASGYFTAEGDFVAGTYNDLATDTLTGTAPALSEFTASGSMANTPIGTATATTINTSNSCLQDFTDGAMSDECDLSSYFARTGDQCGDDDGSITCVETDDEPLLTSDGLHSVGSYTNGFVESTDYSNGTWVKAFAEVNPGYSDPKGGTGAYQLIDDNGGGSGGSVRIFETFTVSSGDPHTVSAFFAPDQVGWVRFRTADFDAAANDDTWFDLANCVAGTTGANHTAHVDQYGDWCRVGVTITSTTDLDGTLLIYPQDADSTSGDRDGTTSILIYQADSTQSAFMLPPVYTAGSTVTADSAIVGPVDLSAVASGWSDPVNGISGHVIFSFMRDYDQDTGNFFRLFGLGDGTSAETLEVVAHSSAARFILFKDTNSVTPDASTTDGEHNWTAGESISVAFRASSAGIKLWVTSESGQTIDENTTANAQADFQAGISQFYIGAGGDGSGGGDFFKIECFVPYDKALPDEVLANMDTASCGH